MRENLNVNRDKYWITSEYKQRYNKYKRVLSEFNITRSKEIRIRLNKQEI